MEIEFPEKLEFLLGEGARYKVAYGGRGGGKCLAIGTRVIMFDGSLKAVEDIKTNDLLMGPDSKPRKVLGTTRGRSQMFKINQTSGMSYVVNSSHILSLKKSKSSIVDGRYPEYKTVTNINVVEAFNKSKRWKDNFRGYRAGLINFSTQEIFIDPWYLGMWLGDGKANDCIIYTGDKEIFDGVEDYAFKLGMRTTVYEEKGNCVAIRITKFLHQKNGRENLLWQNFIQYELVNNKHIPLEYKANSEKIRLELLAGLIDSDGYLNNHNGYEIIQTNEKLANDIKFLADGLGFRTYMRKKKTICQTGVEGEAFRLTINGDTWRIPCRVPRKIVKRENVRKNKDFLLSQIDIEPVGEGEYAGFSLDGDHLFLLEDGTVTHNTENFARALIILATQKRLRIVCFREFQKSIKESVHETIKNQIFDMGLDSEFSILDQTIISKRTGAEFIFFGLRYNINSIKSLARIDIAWVEEANVVSKGSWDKLAPTIRGRHESDKRGLGGPFGRGPEIWVSFNPELDTDETYRRFILEPPAEFDANGNKYAIIKKINYNDNPWFPPDLREEMEQARLRNENTYLEVWEGHTKQTLEGAIYTEEIKQTLLKKRRGHVPYDPTKPVYTFWDLGHSDKTAIWFIQRVGMNFNVINYYQNNLKKIGHYLEHLQSLKYIYGTVYMPHDADNETLASRSIKKITQDAGYKVTVVAKPAKKVLGINAVRTVFELCNFDEKYTSDGWQCLCRYAYEVDENGTFSKEPEHDTPWSHGADAFQTFALSLKTETAAKKKPSQFSLKEKLAISSQDGWMG